MAVLEHGVGASRGKRSGEIAVGDRVAIQLMYSPLAIERIYPERVKPLELKAQLNRIIDVKLPLLSNRLEFEVTAEMLKRK